MTRTCILTTENMHTADDCTMHEHEAEIVGRWITITRRGYDDRINTFFGLCEWASADLLNFRLKGVGHIGITRTNGTVEIVR